MTAPSGKPTTTRNAAPPPEPPEVCDEYALEMVAGASQRVPAGDLEKALCERFSLNRRDAALIVRRLVRGGELAYAYELGCSFLEVSFQKPIKISDRLVLVPADRTYVAKAGDVPVCLKCGAAFGCGRHPTTRLALKGIDHALKDDVLSNLAADRPRAVLDIGTGSGVLVIAAVQLGIDVGIGIDIDPCAGVEARENVRLNGLEDRVRISVQSLGEHDVGGGFLMITANLRLPGLVQMCGQFAGLTAKQGSVVLSGIRSDEMQPLIDACGQHHLMPCWQATEKGWAGVVFRKERRINAGNNL